MHHARCGEPWTHTYGRVWPPTLQLIERARVAVRPLRHSRHLCLQKWSRKSYLTSGWPSGAVLRGNAMQAACLVSGVGGVQGRCIRPYARPLEYQPGLGAQPEAADRPPGKATCRDTVLMKAGLRVAAGGHRLGVSVAAAAPATALGLAAASAAWHSTGEGYTKRATVDQQGSTPAAPRDNRQPPPAQI